MTPSNVNRYQIIVLTALFSPLGNRSSYQSVAAEILSEMPALL
jgi:hypothetical protein